MLVDEVGDHRRDRHGSHHVERVIHVGHHGLAQVRGEHADHSHALRAMLFDPDR